jgi:hypothetical protein
MGVPKDPPGASVGATGLDCGGAVSINAGVDTGVKVRVMTGIDVRVGTRVRTGWPVVGRIVMIGVGSFEPTFGCRGRYGIKTHAETRTANKIVLPIEIVTPN